MPGVRDAISAPHYFPAVHPSNERRISDQHTPHTVVCLREETPLYGPINRLLAYTGDLRRLTLAQPTFTRHDYTLFLPTTIDGGSHLMVVTVIVKHII
jgi:hypothetical protein